MRVMNGAAVLIQVEFPRIGLDGKRAELGPLVHHREAEAVWTSLSSTPILQTDVAMVGRTLCPYPEWTRGASATLRLPLTGIDSVRSAFDIFQQPCRSLTSARRNAVASRLGGIPFAPCCWQDRNSRESTGSATCSGPSCQESTTGHTSPSRYRSRGTEQTA